MKEQIVELWLFWVRSFRYQSSGWRLYVLTDHDFARRNFRSVELTAHCGAVSTLPAVYQRWKTASRPDAWVWGSNSQPSITSPKLVWYRPGRTYSDVTFSTATIFPRALKLRISLARWQTYMRLYAYLGMYSWVIMMTGRPVQRPPPT